jgi:hypothetical protein
LGLVVWRELSKQFIFRYTSVTKEIEKHVEADRGDFNACQSGDVALIIFLVFFSVFDSLAIVAENALKH